MEKMSSRNCQEMISFASDALTLNFEVWLSVHWMSKRALHCSRTPHVFRGRRIFNFVAAESRKWHHRQQTMMHELCPGRWQIRLSVSKADVKSRFKNVRSPWVLKVSSPGLLRELKSRFSRHGKDQDSAALWKKFWSSSTGIAAHKRLRFHLLLAILCFVSGKILSRNGRHLSHTDFTLTASNTG